MESKMVEPFNKLADFLKIHMNLGDSNYLRNTDPKALFQIQHSYATLQIHSQVLATIKEHPVSY